MNNRIVIPKALRNQILHCLHAAHQGTLGMSARANQTVYWPGLNAAIRTHRSNCSPCNQIAPSQPAEPLILTPDPEWPFQQIYTDYFEHEGHSYLTTVDRYSFWINIYHLPNTTATSSLLSNLRTLFASYGVPEEIASDGGQQFSSTEFQLFLKTWGIHHRLSSAEYPQSNGRAELVVKTAKCIILENTNRGSLNTDKAARALLQYRNTPIQSLGLSPAQILFHRQLRDHLPAHPTHLRLHSKWLKAAKNREQLAAIKKERILQSTTQPVRNLPNLPVGTFVAIQDQRSKKELRKWIHTGVIVEVLPFRQYRIKVDGSGRLWLRNRRFLKPIPIPSITSPATPPSIDTNVTINEMPQPTGNVTTSKRMPRLLRELESFNKPGLKE